ncbi:glycosyltransferase family 2 protein [Persicobacter diffluens]|uniref:Glycosyl transferase n=1 Tax=Persicobacter diffluens TaxID=981 RepID=A0AAN4VX53_9BACT|nr:glycosyl transferase [Persicobacter diffluens]
MEIIISLLLLYFTFNACYWLFFSLSGLFYTTLSPKEKSGDLSSFLVLIPAYKEDGVIESVVKENLNQNYPKEKFDIIVIADSFQEDTLKRLEHYPVELLVVEFEQSTKVKALNAAFESLKRDYEYAMILDADNVMAPNCLMEMHKVFSAAKVQAVQGQRTAKNDNTSMAVLDGISEAINNHIYRSGHAAVGMSCPLIGSGMAFEFHLVKRILNEMISVGGFDRELELRLLRENVSVKYQATAITFDEKIQNTSGFYNQRRRWISTQFVYLKKYFFEALMLLMKGNLSFFDNAVIRNLQLPRLLFLGLMGLFTLLALIIPQFVGPFSDWVKICIITLLSIVVAFPRRMLNRKLFGAILLLPKTFLLMLLALLKVKGANKKFIHTTHSSNNVK